MIQHERIIDETMDVVMADSKMNYTDFSDLVEILNERAGQPRPKKKSKTLRQSKEVGQSLSVSGRSNKNRHGRRKKILGVRNSAQ